MANFKIHPAITVAANEVVLFNELLRDVRHFNADIFGVRHGSIQVEILQIDGAKARTFSREHAVYSNLDQFKGSSVCPHISWITNTAAPNSDLGMVRIILFRTDFTDDERVTNFFAFVCRDIIVIDEKKCVSPFDAFGCGRGTCTNPLAKPA